MPAPPLTIAVPFHSGVDYLKRALDSVLVQGVAPARVMVVDDAGPDGDAAAALVAGYDPGSSTSATRRTSGWRATGTGASPSPTPTS